MSWKVIRTTSSRVLHWAVLTGCLFFCGPSVRMSHPVSMSTQELKYCSDCGAELVRRVPEGDHLSRYVCPRCGKIHYQNPKVVAGCIASWGGQVLLCRRAISPRAGLWTLPAGFMENGETTAEAAARETREEANAEVTNLHLYALFNLPHISQVYVIFRGQLVGGCASAGPESLDVALFQEHQIPWDALAFPVIGETLQLFFGDRGRGEFPVHAQDIIRDPDGSVRFRRYT